ncbi:MAG: c-type cytochrome, partial [Deltaproteobacteria bacterium]|nr:c-type cytochrome [Deltaproteobacteria bacterium]
MSERTRTSRQRLFARGLALALSAGVALASLGLAAGAFAAAPTLSDEQFKDAQFIYFDRCSGCHGTLRKGATGPAINDEEMLKQKLSKLEETIFEGTDAGMPGWGRTGDLTQDQAKLMSKFLQLPAPIPPEMGLKEMKASWKVKVPVAERPKKQQHDYDIDNMFGVILRDAGKGAFIDGDSKELVS